MWQKSEQTTKKQFNFKDSKISRSKCFEKQSKKIIIKYKRNAGERMNKESKATIAYIAGRLISKKDTSSIYDYDQAKHINMSGEVNEKNACRRRSKNRRTAQKTGAGG